MSLGLSRGGRVSVTVSGRCPKRSEFRPPIRGSVGKVLGHRVLRVSARPRVRRGVECARNFVGIGEANKVSIFLELAFSTQPCRFQPVPRFGYFPARYTLFWQAATLLEAFVRSTDDWGSPLEYCRRGSLFSTRSAERQQARREYVWKF